MLCVAFPLLFLIFYLCLYFCQFDFSVSRCVPPWVHPAWDSASWTWMTIFFSMLGKFSAIISSNIFSGPFCLSLLLLGPL